MNWLQKQNFYRAYINAGVPLEQINAFYQETIANRAMISGTARFGVPRTTDYTQSLQWINR